jgi:hypothetical protein
LPQFNQRGLFLFEEFDFDFLCVNEKVDGSVKVYSGKFERLFEDAKNDTLLF